MLGRWLDSCLAWGMIIQSAMDSIQIHMEGPETRSELYKQDKVSEFSQWLSGRDTSFKCGEFEESVNLLYGKFLSHEDTHALLHRVDWLRTYWSFLIKL